MKNMIKNKSARLLVTGGLILSASCFTSCEDFLTILPTNQIPEENFWEDKSDLEGVRAAAYQKITQASVTGRMLYWGEFRGDNLDLNKMENTSIMYLQDGVLQPTESMFSWADFYSGINYCNLVLEKGEEMVANGTDPSFSNSDWRPVKAEMLSLRALYYFYLVRAYRDVPFVTVPVHTDEEALNSRIAATSGKTVLASLINDLESAINLAQVRFSQPAENKGRFTRNSVRTLLADIYLWQGCLYKRTDPNAARQCFEKAYQHSTQVLNDMMAKYKEDLDKNNNATNEQLTQKYPMLLNTPSTLSVTDNPYNQIFGGKNSDESIFEIQYSQVDNNKNTSITSYLGYYSSQEMHPAIMTVSSSLLSTSLVNPEVGFGKTDFRMVETCDVRYKETKKPMLKNIATSINILDMENVSMGYSASYRTSEEQYGNWPVYRLSDLLLIRAEACARYWNIANASKKGEDFTEPATYPFSLTSYDIAEAFESVNALFKRNNPKLVGTDDASDVANEFKVDRLSATYSAKLTCSELLTLVYRERQREFVGEAKRWFDLVRQAEYTGDYKATLTDFGTFKSSVKNRLTSINAFYNPIYSEELKVNGVEYGGSLTQNPA